MYVRFQFLLLPYYLFIVNRKYIQIAVKGKSPAKICNNKDSHQGPCGEDYSSLKII